MHNTSPTKVVLIRSRAIDPSVEKIARTLVKSGYEVELLVWAREGKITNSPFANGYKIHSFKLKAPYYKLRLFFYLIVWSLYVFFFLLKSRAKIIHAVDLDTLYPALLVKVIKKVKLCYTIYDFYADILPRRMPRIVKRTVAFAEKFALRFVNVLFLVDESRYEQIEGAKVKRIEYVYNSPEDYFKSLGKPAQTPEINVFYAGYLDKSRALEAIINTVGELDNVNLTIAGGGPGTDVVKSYLTKYTNFAYLGQISTNEVMTNTLKADILFAFYDPELPNNKYASPNKLYDAMMSATPIIVNEGTNASKIVTENKCGLIVPYGDTNALKEALQSLINDPELRRRLGNKGRQAYEAHYNWKIMRDRLINAYAEITQVETD